MSIKKRPLVLISNDDGVEAEGIRQLSEALRGWGDIVVFAPDRPRSGTSCAITADEPVRYQLIGHEDGLTRYCCTGTPVDCVKLAVGEVLPRIPDLLLSGINHGGNQALSVHYSGTMGAAFEGCVFNIPSMGVSLQGFTDGADFSAACRYARFIAGKLFDDGLPRGVYLNLNVPNVPRVKGLRAGRQTGGKWVREYVRETDGDGALLFRLTGEYQAAEPLCPDHDVVLLDGGYASIVPCRIDVTDVAFMNELKRWETQ
jgi:5'-nucleotidase